MPQPPSHDEHVASQSAVHEQTAVGRGSCIEVFLVFLRLGLTSFGGPVAHLGYFRTEFVDRRRWLDDYTYSDLVALCQFLPGPASSQVGMAIGLKRAGWTGMLAAWLAFTLPSAMALMLFALGLAHFGWLSGSAAIHGLKVAAVAVIAQAVWGMGRTLCPDRIRAGMACVAALITLALPSAPGQLAAIALGAVVGAAVLQLPPRPLLGQPSQRAARRGMGAAGTVRGPVDRLAGPGRVRRHAPGRATRRLLPGRRAGFRWRACGVAHAGIHGGGRRHGVATGFPGGLWRGAGHAGALVLLCRVFGRGCATPAGGWMGWISGFSMLAMIFLPGALLLAGAMPFWDGLRRRPGVRNMLAGVNAAVVGVLLSALYDRYGRPPSVDRRTSGWPCCCSACWCMRAGRRYGW